MASTFKSLERATFPIIILDECSQLMEPTSLIPISRFGCQQLMLVGDPKQLPPVLNAESKVPGGLDRTLFDRLVELGHVPIPLAIQYRVISSFVLFVDSFS